MDKVQKILHFAMQMEKDAGDFYSYYMDKVKSESAKELFRELVDTERQHHQVLREKYDELGYKEPPISLSWVVDNAAATRSPHILADNSDIVGDPQNDISDLSVLRMAYLMENDFAEFYTNAADCVEDDETKRFLCNLANWEKQHREMFYEKYRSMLKKHWADISSIIFV